MKIPKRFVPTGKKFEDGGMSEAILCRDEHLDREVVIKGLAAGVEPKRLLDEVSALQAIRSKYVVQIFDVIHDEKETIVGLVEEYLPGKDLTSVDIPKTWQDLLRILYPVAKGIADIHAHGLVHRDIKRRNLKYDAEGYLKIFDFGLARDVTLEASTKGALGTPGYMAPELFKADASGKVTFTADIDTFAFASTALAIATGGLPKDLQKTPPSLPCKEADFSKLPQALPDEIAVCLNSCFDSEPSRRPKMANVARLIGLYLLRDQHRALLVSGGKTYLLNKDNRVVQLAVVGKGALTIGYDGLRFVLSKVSGNVSINNMFLKDGDILPGSCVIVLGDQAPRTMITVDVSHPEVTL